MFGSGTNNIRLNRFILLVIIITIAVAIYLVITPISRIGKSKVTIFYAPGTAIVSVNNKELKHTACTDSNCFIDVFIKNGQATVSSSLVNFSTATQTINTKNNEKITLISTPINDIGTKYVEDNAFVKFQIQNASSGVISEGSTKISQKYNFLDKLNLYGGGYTVGYGASTYMARDPYSVALYVDSTTTEGRKKAISAIVEELSLSTSDIEIIYNDFNNPFMENK